LLAIWLSHWQSSLANLLVIIDGSVLPTSRASIENQGPNDLTTLRQIPEVQMTTGLSKLAPVVLCLLAGTMQGRADDPSASEPASREIEVAVPGEWKFRPATGEKRSAWSSAKTPSKIAIKSDQECAFDVARDITDDQLSGLKALKDVPLESLIVASDRMTDAGMAHIAQLSSVRFLYLSACRGITDKGLVHLSKIAHLPQIWITANTRITDEGIKTVAELKELKKLSLFGCKQITDVGAGHLKKAIGLKFVFFGGTSVTEAGVADLQKVLPSCDVKR
jgi:hypothetical protein